MTLPPTEDELNEQIMRNCHEITLNPIFGSRLTISFRRYDQGTVTLTRDALAVTVYGNGRIAYDYPQGLAEAEAAIKRVRELHRKATYYKHASECDCPDKDTVEDHNASEIDGDHEEYCLKSPAWSSCAECDPEGEMAAWPCDTIRALDGDAPKETTT